MSSTPGVNTLSLQMTLSPSQVNAAETAQWKEILAQGLTELRVSIPGIIQDFDPITQTATVQIAVREAVQTGSGTQNIAIYPISKVPIHMQRAGGYSLLLPIHDGDECLLIFSDMNIDAWWQNGGIQNQIERRRHDLTDCFAILGPWNQKRVFTDYPTDSAQLRSDDGTTVIDIAEAGITMSAPKVTINSSGDVDINATGKINLNSTSDTNITATGAANITGNPVNIVSSGSNSTIDGENFLEHTHDGVQAGGDISGPVFP